MIQFSGKVIHYTGFNIRKKIVSSDGYISAISGYLGGYIESLDNLSEEGGCAILHEAKVWGNARVFGDAWIDKNAEVYGNAQVYEKAVISSNSKIYGDAQIHGYVYIRNEDIGSGNIA